MTESKETILHIDDDEANRYAVRRILEKSGFYIIEASTGHEGIDLARRALPDLIILDIKLPDINGFEVCKILKADEETNKISVLQTSASFVSSDNKVTGLESGADGYLAQPIEAAVLVATVKSLLRIRKAEKTAYEAMRSREEVLAIVSHDLRNPLSFIMLQVRLMEGQLNKGKATPEEVINKMKKVNNSCLKMNRLIQDLLDVSNLDQGNFEPNIKSFPLHQLFDDVNMYYEDIAMQSEVSLLTNLNGLGDVEFNGDKERLQQVLSNLISNSLKFTPSGGEVSMNLEQHNNQIYISVSDTGSGINSKDLPHVFNRYWQGHPERKSGYGIGLSIVKGITEAHGGTIHIQSEEGKGTTVTLKLPQTSKV